MVLRESRIYQSDQSTWGQASTGGQGGSSGGGEGDQRVRVEGVVQSEKMISVQNRPVKADQVGGERGVQEGVAQLEHVHPVVVEGGGGGDGGDKGSGSKEDKDIRNRAFFMIPTTSNITTTTTTTDSTKTTAAAVVVESESKLLKLRNEALSMTLLSTVSQALNLKVNVVIVWL